MECPKLRSLEMLPVETREGRFVCLRDPLGLASGPAFVPMHLFFIVSMFDGQHTIAEIQAAYVRQFGQLLFSDKIIALAEQLDEQHFLDSERFAAHRREVEASFRAVSVRVASHAGSAYPTDPGALREQFAALFERAAEQEAGEASDGGVLRALVAPHIDFNRGGMAYGRAYRKLQNTAHRLFVILGVAHQATEKPYALTAKDFETTLGTMKCDRPFVERLTGKLSQDFFRDEFIHRSEHSVEFQVVMLQYALPNPNEARIIPIICGGFAVEPEEKAPASLTEVAEFLDALRETMGEEQEPPCLIAGVDLAHVGPRFGDAQPASPQLLGALERQDREMLACVLEGDAEGFHRNIQTDGDRRRVCGYPALYTLLSLAPALRGQLLTYEQSVEETGSVVTFASLALYER